MRAPLSNRTAETEPSGQHGTNHDLLRVTGTNNRRRRVNRGYWSTIRDAL
jgi:hypothetical protein